MKIVKRGTDPNQVFLATCPHPNLVFHTKSPI